VNGDRTHLLIPIHVDALVGGENDLDSRGLAKNGIVSAAPSYAKLKDFYLTGPELRRPQETLDPPLEPGVHLHFRLPTAVAHGNLERNPAFPRLPNRWLIQRYFMEGGALRTKAWLVYSDKQA